MSLTTEVFDLCKNLASRGWKRLFDAHGLNIVQTNPHWKKKHSPRTSRRSIAPNLASPIFRPRERAALNLAPPREACSFTLWLRPMCSPTATGNGYATFQPRQRSIWLKTISMASPHLRSRSCRNSPEAESWPSWYLARSIDLPVRLATDAMPTWCICALAWLALERRDRCIVAICGIHPRCCRRPVRHGSSAGSIRCLCCHTKSRQRVGFPAIAVSRGS